MASIELPQGIRLFATDLDGTLLLPDGGLGERTLEGLSALMDAGVVVVFVTGRPPRWVRPIAELTSHHGTAIGANGAVVLDLHDEVVTRVRSISPDDALTTAHRLRALADEITFAVEFAVEGGSFHQSHFGLERRYVPRWEISDDAYVAEGDELFGNPGITKILARLGGDHGHDADTFLAAARAAVMGLVEVTHSNADDVLLEMSGHGVTKGSTLQMVAAEHGIDARDVVAVGDMPNDISMLSWAGHSFAVADAHPAAQAAAGQTIGSNADEAVADLVEAILATL